MSTGGGFPSYMLDPAVTCEFLLEQEPGETDYHCALEPGHLGRHIVAWEFEVDDLEEETSTASLTRKSEGYESPE